jgi:O-antigen/teichoic acid export membrane protein
MIKNSIIYLGSSILNKAVPFLLLPIMTTYLSPADYGILSIYMIFISFTTAFIGMNMHMNISKNFFKVSKDAMALYIGNILYLLIISFLIYTIISFGVNYYFDELFSISTKWILLLPIISLLFMINEINTTVLRNEQRAYMFGIFEVSNTALKMSITIIFLVLLHYGWQSQVFGIIFSGVIFAFIGIYYLYNRNYIKFKLDTDKIKSILHISVPLIPHLLGGIIIAMSDRLFIENMVSIEAVGIYTVGYMFGMIVMLFTDAFIKAWSPWFYKNLSQPTNEKKKKIVYYTYIYIISIFLLAISISFVAKIILPYFVGDKFVDAQQYILWISLGYAIQGIYKIFFPYLVHISKTGFLAFSTFIAALLNLAFNYVFIKYFGTIGAAYATMLAFGVSATLVFLYQNKHYPMPWFLREELS